jgi:hypothetical protein
MYQIGWKAAWYVGIPIAVGWIGIYAALAAVAG